MKVHRGGIYWARRDPDDADEIVHPHVVLQDDALNGSRIESTVVCGISTNMKKAYERGNVLLEPGEANLQRRSIVVVSQVSVLAKSALGDYIGTLSAHRVDEILEGMRQVERARSV